MFTFGSPMSILLIGGSLATILFMLMRIRASRVQIRDCVFWIFFSLLLLVFSVWPALAAWAARLLGIEAPINFMYLFIIFVLLIRLFSNTLRISQLDAKVQTLTQRIALREKDVESGGEET